MKSKVRKKKKITTEKRIEKDLIRIFIFLAFLVIVYLIVSSVFKSFNQFEHEGLRFTKERFGEIMVYHHYYYFNAPATGDLIRYNLFLKQDPRTNEIPMESKEINFPFVKTVFISVDASTLKECKESAVGVATLSAFLTDNQLEVKGGTNDFIEATLHGYEYYTCETKVINPVINIVRGEETKIMGDGLCYTITIGPECNIVEAIEKFQIESVLDAKGRGYKY